MNICNTYDCTGCFACMNICTKDAISVITDDLGKTIPHIDSSKCIECGLCKKICPVENAVELKKTDDAFAVWSNEDKDREVSSSGGAAAVFSRYVLKNGGCVFGASSNGGITNHICIEDEKDIDRLRGSKYVQSFIGLTYREIKNKLDKGKFVLFTGTPCQVAGLNSFLHKDYDNLITVDLICHGTPPHKYLEEHINEKLNGKKWDCYSFRGKYDWFLSVYCNKKIIYQTRRESDEYFMAFLNAMTFRDNCYKCKYARKERVSDITIGDFWGLDRKNLKNQYKGRISLVLPNTENGQSFFDKCKDRFTYEKRSIEEAANPMQGNLLQPSIPHKEREIFIEKYKKDGFEKAVRGTLLGKLVRKNRLKGNIKAVAKKIPFLKKAKNMLSNMRVSG